MNGEVVLLEMDYTTGIKHPYIGHNYVLQNVLILKAIQITFYMMYHSSSFMRDPAPTVNRHTTTAFVGRQILGAVTLSLRFVN
jgi:hypothetical protein